MNLSLQKERYQIQNNEWDTTYKNKTQPIQTLGHQRHCHYVSQKYHYKYVSILNRVWASQDNFGRQLGVSQPCTVHCTFKNISGVTRQNAPCPPLPSTPFRLAESWHSTWIDELVSDWNCYWSNLQVTVKRGYTRDSGGQSAHEAKGPWTTPENLPSR